MKGDDFPYAGSSGSGHQEWCLTPDNPLLSGPKTGDTEADQVAPSPVHEGPDGGQKFAIDCTHDLSHEIKSYIEAGIAPATRRAYRADLDHFRAWGGDVPATDGQIAAYIAAHATTLKVATLTRRLAAISVAHDAQGMPNPVRSPLVRATMRGVRRERGSAQRQAKPLLREDLFALLVAMGDGVKDARDRALLLLGFAGGFRRSELVGLDCTDIERVRQGIIVILRRSKTDQDGQGRKIGIPFGRTKWCPVGTLDRWLDAASIEDGAIFRRVDRHARVLPERLSAEAVSLIVQERVAAAGYDATTFSGHSLRAGFATSAAQAGVSSQKIRQQTGHASDAMLARYVRDGELFTGNPAVALL
jgi:integrase